MDADDRAAAYRYERNALAWWLAANPVYEGYLWKNIVVDKMVDAVGTFHKALLLIRSNRSVEHEYGFDAIAIHRTTKEPVFLQFKTSRALNTLKADRFATFIIALISMNHVVEQETGVKAFARSVIVSDTPVASTFREFSAVFLKTEFHVVTDFDEPVAEPKKRVATKKIVLRQDQNDAVAALAAFEGRYGLLEAPGGWGKTLVMAEYIRSLEKTVCVVAPTKPLCRQLETVLWQRGVTDIARVTSDTSSDVEDLLDEVLGTRRVVVVTNDTYRTVLFNKNVDVVVFDEGHNFRSTITFPDVHRRLLFVTATPPSPNEWACQQNIVTVYRKPFADAVSEKIVLAPEIVVPIAKDGVVLSQDRDDVMELAKYILEQAIRGGDDRAVVFVKSCTFGQRVVDSLRKLHEKFCHKLYLGRSLEAALVRDSTSQTVREALRKSFGKDPTKIYVLVSVRILAEGMDLVPCNSVVLYEPGTWSFLKKQMVFRASRKDPSRPAKTSRVHLFAPDGSGGGITTMADIIHALGTPIRIKTRVVGRLEVESETDQDAMDGVEKESGDTIRTAVTNDLPNAARRVFGEDEEDGTSGLDAVSAEALVWRRLNDLKTYFEAHQTWSDIKKSRARTSDGGIVLYEFRKWCMTRSRRLSKFLGHREDVRKFAEAFDPAFYTPTLSMKVDSARRCLEKHGVIRQNRKAPLYHDGANTIHTNEWAVGAWVGNMKRRGSQFESAMRLASDDDRAKFERLASDYPRLFRVTTVADMAMTLRRFIASHNNSLEPLYQKTKAPLWAYAENGGEDVELEPSFNLGKWVYQMTPDLSRRGFDADDPAHVKAWDYIKGLVEQYPHKFYRWRKWSDEKNSGGSEPEPTKKRKRDS